MKRFFKQTISLRRNFNSRIEPKIFNKANEYQEEEEEGDEEIDKENNEEYDELDEEAGEYEDEEEYENTEYFGKVLEKEGEKLNDLFKNFTPEKLKGYLDSKGSFVDLSNRLKEAEKVTGASFNLEEAQEDPYYNRILALERELKEKVYGERGSQLPKYFTFKEIQEFEEKKSKEKEEESFWFEKVEEKRPILPWEKEEKEKLKHLEKVKKDSTDQVNKKSALAGMRTVPGEVGQVPYQDDIIDPSYEFLLNLDDGKETEVAWNQNFIKKLWDIVGGEPFSKTEEFFDQRKFAIKEDSIIERLSLILPGLELDKVKVILYRMINILKKNKTFTANELTIQTITDTIARQEEPIYFKWADRFQTINPKFEGVEKAFAKISKGRVSAKEMKRAGEIAASINSMDYPHEYDYYYEVLKPLFEEKDSLGEDKKTLKEYQPKIYGGRSFGRGKRKSSIARCWMQPGTGIIKINGKNHDIYFKNTQDLFNVMFPLHLMRSFKHFDFKIKVQGGGTTGQSEAIKLAMSKAIITFLPEYGLWYRRNGMLTSDSRRVERKKPGYKKARKKTQWVKR